MFKRNEKRSVEDQIVTAVPDIETRKMTDELEFILLACDGIWDVMSNSEVVNFVRARIAEKMDPSIVNFLFIITININFNFGIFF